MDNRTARNEKKTIILPKGLLGFEDFKEFLLSESEYNPFLWFQSVEEEKLSFLIVDPYYFFPDYELDIDDSLLSTIGDIDSTEYSVYVIITIPKESNCITANLQGPLIINNKTNKGLQAILSDERWSTKHPLVNTIKDKTC